MLSLFLYIYVCVCVMLGPFFWFSHFVSIRFCFCGSQFSACQILQLFSWLASIDQVWNWFSQFLYWSSFAFVVARGTTDFTVFQPEMEQFLGFCQSSCIDQLLPLYQPVLHQILQLFSRNVVSFEIVSLRLISPFCIRFYSFSVRCVCGCLRVCQSVC